MRITFCLTDNQPRRPGSRACAPRCPDASVENWAPGAPQADHAVVWAPPQHFIDEQPRLRGIFNIGAGVDALLKLKLPPQTPGGAARRCRHVGADGRVRLPCADPAFPRVRRLRGRGARRAAGPSASRASAGLSGRHHGPGRAGRARGAGAWRSSSSRSTAGAARPRPSRACAALPAQAQFDAFLARQPRAGVPAAADAATRAAS